MKIFKSFSLAFMLKIKMIMNDFIFQAENQENSSLFANESLSNTVHPPNLADSFIKRKSPKQSLPSPPKNQSGLILRTEWKR